MKLRLVIKLTSNTCHVIHIHFQYMLQVKTNFSLKFFNLGLFFVSFLTNYTNTQLITANPGTQSFVGIT